MKGSDQQWQSESENTCTVTGKLITNRSKVKGKVKTMIRFITQEREMGKPKQLTDERTKRRKRKKKTENRSNKEGSDRSQTNFYLSLVAVRSNIWLRIKLSVFEKKEINTRF